MYGEHHVMYDPQRGQWYFKKSGSSVQNGYYDTQEEAIQVARAESRNNGTELYIHTRDGNVIRDKDSHGNDPFPPRG